MQGLTFTYLARPWFNSDFNLNDFRLLQKCKRRQIKEAFGCLSSGLVQSSFVPEKKTESRTTRSITKMFQKARSCHIKRKYFVIFTKWTSLFVTFCIKKIDLRRSKLSLLTSQNSETNLPNCFTTIGFQFL